MIIIERNTDVRIKCFKCGNQFSMDQMRMSPQGSNLMCKNCLERKPVATQAPKKAADPYAEVSSSKRSSEKTSYFCKACRYSFTRASHIDVSSCPYCSALGTVVSKGSASSMIKEVDEMVDDE